MQHHRPRLVLQALVAERGLYSRLQTDRESPMPSMLEFFYGRKISDQSFGAKSVDNLGEGREEFSVSWVVHRYETLPLKVEHCILGDLDELVESCKSKLPEMRDRYPNTPPDGFLVFDNVGTKVRRWFGSPRRSV